MIVQDILPAAPLKEYIQQYRVRHFVFAKGMIPPAKPFPPRPEQCLTFYIRGYETAFYLNDQSRFRKPRSVLSGQFTGRVDRYLSYPEVLMIIVDLQPGALHRLTHIPFAVFTDKDVDAETVLSPEIKYVNDRLGSTASYPEMIGIIEEFFMQLVKQAKGVSPADHMLSMIAHDAACSIDQLARECFLSVRQLQRKFQESVGISPKSFLRIVRFNQSYRMHLNKPALNWSQIAMACGYTDYQHLVKEYRQFANNTPALFFTEESNAPGRILGLNKMGQ